jgi:hypothetical protein
MDPLSAIKLTNKITTRLLKELRVGLTVHMINEPN